MTAFLFSWNNFNLLYFKLLKKSNYKNSQFFFIGFPKVSKNYIFFSGKKYYLRSPTKRKFSWVMGESYSCAQTFWCSLLTNKQTDNTAKYRLRLWTSFSCIILTIEFSLLHLSGSQVKISSYDVTLKSNIIRLHFNIKIFLFFSIALQ